MFQTNPLNGRHALSDVAPHMPIDILLAFPDYVSDFDNLNWLFNLPGAINDLMGGVGWEKATQVLKPYLWAPDWDDEQLYNFAAGPFGRNKHPFPQIDPQSLRATRREFEIIHFVGNVLEGERPALDLSHSGVGRVHSYEDIKTGLREAGTRLLILQNPGFRNEVRPEEYRLLAARLAEAVIADGGPPVLIIAGAESPDPLTEYLTDFYANIIHNTTLSEAARPRADLDPGIWAELFLGEGGDEILLISRLRDHLYERIDSVRETVDPLLQESFLSKFNAMKPYLDSHRIKEYEILVRDQQRRIRARVSNVLDKTKEMRQELDFSHETGGAVPLGETSKALPMVEAESDLLILETTASMASLDEQYEAEAKKAPRVLNAIFSSLQDGHELEQREPLIAGQDYYLNINVGRKKKKSIVIGKEAFPESLLPPDEKEGYAIHVVFISNDTDPKLFSDWIFVPRHTGDSFPYDTQKKRKAEKSGAISFLIKAPALKNPGDQLTRLHGRLCLYYENNLLQSARVEASVARTPGVVIQVDNVVDVDYVMSATVQDLERFATRKLKFTKDEPLMDHPISLNITLNDDGKEHRLLVREHDNGPATGGANNAPVGWTPFDAAAGRQALDEAREDLKSCFYLRDNDGNVLLDNAKEPRIGVDSHNGKNKTQFLWDLFTLAKLGANLFNTAFGDVRPSGQWPTRAAWARALQKRLETSSIIQVARTGPANYVFPWGLVYQYPLPGPRDRIKFCQITEEWAADGRRQKDLAKNCEHRLEKWHEENVICPYGFWGLNHIIEQPISALRKLEDGSWVLDDARDKIVMGSTNLDLSVSITHDVSQTALDAHLKRLGNIQPMRLNPEDPADNTDKVREMLKTATLSYFLCHGEYDGNKPYLSIGVRDNNQLHRIYPEMVQDWGRIDAWQTNSLVFINGCHTANLRPGEVLNFVTAFSFAGASGVIGTEVSVLAEVAIEISELLFAKIADKTKVGEAMYQTRWEMANKGNLLGLAYTLYCLSNLHVANN